MPMRITLPKAITLIACLISSYGQADQLAWISKDQAQKATDYLKQQKQVVLWCACCDGETKRVVNVTGVSFVQVDKDYYQVVLEGTDLSGGSIKENLDLAYVHCNVKGKGVCVGTTLHFECKPCTDPFDWPVSSNNSALVNPQNDNAVTIDKQYYEDGITLKSQCPVTKGANYGVCRTYYKSGKLESQIAYFQNVKYGFEKHFFENGNTQGEIIYIDETNYIIRDYYETGGVKDEVFFKGPDNPGDARKFDNQPQIAKNNLEKGKKIGLWIEYLDSMDSIVKDSNSAVYRRMTNYVNGQPDGTVRVFTKNGAINREMFYKNGKQNGPEQWYYNTGELQEEAMFHNGKKAVAAIAFFKNGIVSREIDFTDEGEYKVEDKVFGENGIIKQSTFYSNGVKSAYDEYYPDGKLAKETVYQDGKDIGVTTNYTKQGEPIDN
jgi:antitoxin component YwqK of YwqJK toxin-antitoxin module